MAEHSRPTHRQAARRIPASVMVLAFIFIAGIGYIAGSFNAQIVGMIAPLFGAKISTETLDLSSVQSTYQAVKANYDGEIDDKALIEGANRGLVEALGDEYTVYMNQQENQEFDNSLTGNIGGGVGIELGMRGDLLTIIRVLKDNPAEEAGLNVNDVIIAVNDEDVQELSVQDAVLKIRGDVGTTVKLTVLRGTATKNFTVTRAQVNNPSVYSSIENGIGIMTVTRFDNETGTLARSAAQSFKSADVKGIVLDLRGNGGGYVTAAQDLASLWLDRKVVVSERKGSTVVDELTSGSNPLLGGVPTVVLVNASSASASEIVAGALKDHDAAQLVGEKTFGKGSVQKLVSLPLSAELKVTVARWYTPRGANISEQGISPDQVITITSEDIDAGRDPQLEGAKALL
jgi:carboxyl-terminal processing protease